MNHVIYLLKGLIVVTVCAVAYIAIIFVGGYLLNKIKSIREMDRDELHVNIICSVALIATLVFTYFIGRFCATFI